MDVHIKTINTDDVEFDKFNPRHESVEEILSDSSFSRLRESVYEFGVLVPIVVARQRPNSSKKYRLIDGERRLRAAQQTKTAKIPARVVSQTTPFEASKQAFHIHMLRKQWDQTAQTRALKNMIKNLKKKQAKMDKKTLRKELQTLTGYTTSQLTSFLRATEYPESVLNDIDDGKMSFSHLVQFEGSFIEQLQSHYPSLLKSIGKDAVREVLIRKAKKKVLNTRALMDYVVPLISRAQNAREKNYVEKLLKDFISDDDLAAEKIYDAYEKKFPGSQKDVYEQLETAIDTACHLRNILTALPNSKLACYPGDARKLKQELDKLTQELTKTKRALRSLSN